jgi:hypothetical protein
MKKTLQLAIAACCVAFSSTSVHAAISTNSLSATAVLNSTTNMVGGIVIAPAGTLVGEVFNDDFRFYEEGGNFVGVGPTVAVGTDLGAVHFSPGSASIFSAASASGQYYLPFAQESADDGPTVVSRGYLTFNYDNSSQTISFISSTVQDSGTGPLVVVATAVPETSAVALLALGACGLGCRRKRRA